MCISIPRICMCQTKLFEADLYSLSSEWLLHVRHYAWQMDPDYGWHWCCGRSGVDIRSSDGDWCGETDAICVRRTGAKCVSWFKQYLFRDNWETIQVLYKSHLLKLFFSCNLVTICVGQSLWNNAVSKSNIIWIYSGITSGRVLARIFVWVHTDRLTLENFYYTNAYSWLSTLPFVWFHNTCDFTHLWSMLQCFSEYQRQLKGRRSRHSVACFHMISKITRGRKWKKTAHNFAQGLVTRCYSIR